MVGACAIGLIETVFEIFYSCTVTARIYGTEEPHRLSLQLVRSFFAKASVEISSVLTKSCLSIKINWPVLRNGLFLHWVIVVVFVMHF